MPHLASPALVLASLGLLTVACKPPKGTDVDPKQLIPAKANAVFGFRVDPLRSSPVGTAIGAAMRQDGDVSAMMDAATKCNVSLEPLRGFVAGEVDGDEFFGVIESPGIGDEDLMRCIEDEGSKSSGDKAGLVMFETRGDVRITPQEGGGYLVILNKDAVAVVDRAWEDAVFAAIEQPSARNTDTTLAKALAEVDPDAHLWATASISESDVADMTDVPGADALRSVAMSLDVSKGIGMDVKLGFTEADKASSFRTALPTLAQELAPSLGEVGLPTDLLASLKVAGEGTVVSAALQIPDEAVPGLVATIATLMATP